MFYVYHAPIYPFVLVTMGTKCLDDMPSLQDLLSAELMDRIFFDNSKHFKEW